MRKASLGALASGLVPLGLLTFAPFQAAYAQGAAGGVQFIEPGQPPVVIHATVEAAEHAHASHSGGGSTGKNLYYHGGAVQTAPKVYLVFWGTQWSADPSGEAAILQSFYSAVGGSSWLNSVTQYCQGVGSGTVSCIGTSNSGLAETQAAVLAGSWYDNASAAPTHPTQSQLAAEAVNAAQYFGNTTSASNANAQYVIATATQNSSTGFGTQYCAWHSSTSSSYGSVAYTNLPYITDAGASCGANFNNLGPLAGITIVSGHEMAESVTDPFPSSGWLDSRGAENGDKCAWITSGQGASADVTLTDNKAYPVQSLWSNAFNGGAGGCVLSY